MKDATLMRRTGRAILLFMLHVVVSNHVNNFARIQFAKRYCVLHSTDVVSEFRMEEAMRDPNAKNLDGDILQHLAHGTVDISQFIVQLLVRNGKCNPHEKNTNGDTGLHIACRHKLPGIRNYGSRPSS